MERGTSLKIASVGESTIDHYLTQDRSFVGGISLNFAVQAKRSDAENVSLISSVGDDPAGTRVRDILREENVDQSAVAVVDGKTATCDIVVTKNGERHFPSGGYRANVLAHFHLTEATANFVCQHNIAMTHYDGGGDCSIFSQLLALNHDHLAYVVDFGDWTSGKEKSLSWPALDKIDLAFFSGDEDTVRRLTPIAATTGCLIIVTLGAGGSVALSQPEHLFQEAVQVDNIVDTTGCGDAFQAAFTVNYFRDGNVAKALLQGAKQASTVIQHFGAFSQNNHNLAAEQTQL